MTIDDAKIVQKWFTGIGTIAEHDLSICLHVFPRDEPGFYIGEYEGEVVASAIRIPWSESKPKVCVPTLPCTIHSSSIKEWTPLYLRNTSKVKWIDIYFFFVIIFIGK